MFEDGSISHVITFCLLHVVRFIVYCLLVPDLMMLLGRQCGRAADRHVHQPHRGHDWGTGYLQLGITVRQATVQDHGRAYHGGSGCSGC